MINCIDCWRLLFIRFFLSSYWNLTRYKSQNNSKRVHFAYTTQSLITKLSVVHFVFSLTKEWYSLNLWWGDLWREIKNSVEGQSSWNCGWRTRKNLIPWKRTGLMKNSWCLIKWVLLWWRQSNPWHWFWSSLQWYNLNRYYQPPFQMFRRDHCHCFRDHVKLVQITATINPILTELFMFGSYQQLISIDLLALWLFLKNNWYGCCRYFRYRHYMKIWVLPFT